MNTFTDFIKSQITDGRTFEEIAAEFSNAMNQLEAASKRNDEKKNYLSDLHTKWLGVHLQGGMTENDLAGYVTYFVANKHPDWDVEQCKVFNEYIKICVEDGPSVLEDDFIGKILSDTIKEVAGIKNDDGNTCVKSPDKTSIDDFFKKFGL